MYKAYRFRLYPQKNQEPIIAQYFGCVRKVYNMALDKRQKLYQEEKESISKFDLIKELTVLKKTQEYSYLSNVHSQCLQSSIEHLDLGYKNAFRRIKQGVKGRKIGFPKFKSKHDSRQSCSFPQNVKVLFDEGLIKFPKLGLIKAKLHRRFEEGAVVKTVTLVRESTGKYFASVLVEYDDVDVPKAPIEEKTSLGLDLGLKTFAVSSKGENIETDNHYRHLEKKLGRLQRQLSRKVKGSCNRTKMRLRIALLHERIRNRRQDELNQISTKLANDNQVVTYFVEDLNVKGMTSNHRLAKTVLDKSWGSFLRLLEQKCEIRGKHVIPIGRFEPSSKTCHRCSHKKEVLSLSERTYICDSCGLEIDRDLNAAINIKQIGLKDVLGRGTPEVTLVD